MSDLLTTQFVVEEGALNWKELSISIIVIEPSSRSRNKGLKMILVPLQKGYRRWQQIQLLQIKENGKVTLGRNCPFFKIINDLNDRCKYTCYAFEWLLQWISNIKRKVGIENSIAQVVCNDAFLNDKRLTLKEKNGTISLFKTLDNITNAMNMNIDYEHKTKFNLFNNNNNIQQIVPFDIITINAPKISTLDATIKLILRKYFHDDVADIIASFIPFPDYLQLQCLSG